jgi:hypothetical protein
MFGKEFCQAGLSSTNISCNGNVHFFQIVTRYSLSAKY